MSSSTSKVRFHFDNIHFDQPLRFGPYHVMQIGDLAAGDTYFCEEHTQLVNEISYILSGRAIFGCNGSEFVVESGDVIINRKGDSHFIKGIEGEPLRYYYIGFEITDCSREEEKCLQEFFKNPPIHPHKADRSVGGAFQDIFDNMLNIDSFSERMVADAVRKLLVWTKRSTIGSNSRVYLPEAVPEKNRILSRICSYLDGSIEQIDSLNCLTKHFHYSYSYLSGLFSGLMGMSLREYFLMRRHERACELLQMGMSVTAVSEKLGYGSIHSFSHAFTKRSGISPAEYKKQIKKETSEL